MKKKIIRLTENDLHQIINESVSKALNLEWPLHVSDKELNSMEKAFKGIQGQDIINSGAKVVKGKIMPDKMYIKGNYNWKGNNLFADAIIELPNGKRHTLMLK